MVGRCLFQNTAGMHLRGILSQRQVENEKTVDRTLVFFSILNKELRCGKLYIISGFSGKREIQERRRLL